ncbi:MAG: gliding motility-associated-like protein [Chitinophagales bacterium]|jgi:gliding motility-associated-like protein
MRKVFFAIITILSVYSVQAQCVTEAILDIDTIDCGDSVNVTINSFARSLLTEVFNPTGPTDPGWAQTAGAIYTNPYIPSPTNDTYFWMGATAVLPAALASNSFNVSFGGQVCFDFTYAVQGGAAPTEGPDLSQEGISFQYSIDGGITWIDIAYMMPNGEMLTSNPGPGFPMLNPPFSATGTPYTVWNTICFTLPPGALTNSTAFQWIQEFNSGACCDHWGLDNIQILAADPAYGLFDEAGNFLPSNMFSVSPTSDSTYTFLYTNGIDDSCTTTATVTLNPTDAGPDIMVACDGLGTSLGATGVAPWATVSWSPITGLVDPSDPNTFALPLVDTDYILTSDCGVDTVTVYVEESFDIDIVQPDTICLNGAAFLNLSTTPASVTIASVEWSNPGTLNSSTGNQVLAEPTTTTQYIATVTSDSGCVIQDSTLLVVEGFSASIEINPSSADLCAGEELVLTADVVTSSAPYTLIQGNYSPYPTTGGTPITGLADENTVGPQTIGFTFPFFGNFYNTFWISSNGWLTFTSPTGSFLANVNIPNGNQPNNLIAWAWDDLDFSAGGTVNSYTGGTAPNQYLVINFLNVPHWLGTPGTEVSVQVVIYQNGLIEINNINVVSDLLTGTMTQGIENSNGSAGVSDASFNNVNMNAIGESWSYVPTTGPVNPVYSWSPPLYLNTTAGPVVTTAPEGDIEYFVTMVDGLCSSTTSVLINVDSLVILGDLDYQIECPEDSLQLNVQFETDIFNAINNGPCTGSGTGIYTLGEVGTGTGTSATSGTPYEGFWEDGKIQILYTAAELNAAGFTGGALESIAFNVVLKGSTAPYDNFRVAVKPTALTTLIGFDNTGGFVQVVNPYSHTTTLGWNNHDFDVLFCWDGLTDLLFEVCFDNLDWTTDDDVATTATPTNTTAYAFADGVNGCTMTTGVNTNSQRPNLRFDFENLVGGLAPITAAWSPVSSFVDATIENPTLLNINGPGQYPITITAGNCSTTDTVNVGFGAGYTITNDTSVCIGESVQLNVVGGSNHAWSPNDGTLTSTSIPNPIATPVNSTDYILSVDLINCSVLDTVTIAVNVLPVSLINGGAAEEVVCNGTRGELISSADINWTNIWTGPETGNGTEIDVNSGGVYTLTSTDQNGCVSSSSILVIYNETPVLDANIIRNILCCTDDVVNVDFASMITNGVTFGEAYWENSTAPSGTSVPVASDEDGTYQVLIVSADGCEQTAQITFQTNCFNPDIVDIDSAIFGTNVNYTVNGDVPVTGETWGPVFIDNSFLANTIVNAYETVWVDAEAEYTLNNGTLHTCVEYDSSQVFIFLLADPVMPDAFTPNGDNLNELLFPINIDPKTTISAFRVFNRWGDVVYDYNGDTGWDGTWESADQPADVYNYYLVIDKVSSELVMSGTVTLIR